MIAYIKGELTELTPALATIEAGGIGYGLNISLNTFSAIQGKKEVKLYVYEAIREDAHQLYGFVNKKEREMFLLLITVEEEPIRRGGCCRAWVWQSGGTPFRQATPN